MRCTFSTATTIATVRASVSRIELGPHCVDRLDGVGARRPVNHEHRARRGVEVRFDLTAWDRAPSSTRAMSRMRRIAPPGRVRTMLRSKASTSRRRPCAGSLRRRLLRFDDLLALRRGAAKRQ
jgi:hypothetical protein